MDTLDQDLNVEIDKTLASLSTHDQDVAAAAAMHMEEAIAQERRALQAEKAGRAAVTELRDERQRIEQAHREAMAKLAVEIEGAEGRTRDEVRTALRLAAASRAALEALSR